MSKKFRLKCIDETRNYFNKEMNSFELMSKKHAKVCGVLNYIQHLLILVYTVTGCIAIFAFATLILFDTLITITVGITSSPVALKICIMTAGIIKYKSIIKKKKKKRNKLVLLAKNKSNRVEVSISKAFNDSNIAHDEFVLINNLLKQNGDMKEQMKNLKNKTVIQRFQAFYKTMFSYCLNCRKNKESKKPEVEKIKKERIMVSSNCEVSGRKKIEIYQRARSQRFFNWFDRG